MLPSLALQTDKAKIVLCFSQQHNKYRFSQPQQLHNSLVPGSLHFLCNVKQSNREANITCKSQSHEAIDQFY